MLQEPTITIWVNPSDEVLFFKYLHAINILSVEAIDDSPSEKLLDIMGLTINIWLSKACRSHWLHVNLPISHYLKLNMLLTKLEIEWK